MINWANFTPAKKSDDKKAADHQGRRKEERHESRREGQKRGGEAGGMWIVWTERAWEESSKVQSAKMKGSCGSWQLNRCIGSLCGCVCVCAPVGCSPTFPCWHAIGQPSLCKAPCVRARKAEEHEQNCLCSQSLKWWISSLAETGLWRLRQFSFSSFLFPNLLFVDRCRLLGKENGNVQIGQRAKKERKKIKEMSRCEPIVVDIKWMFVSN